MSDKMKWCASKRWSVSVITGSGIDGARLSVCRHVREGERVKMYRGDADGLLFANNDAAWAYAHEHGYCERFAIPACPTCRVRHTTKYGDSPARRSAYCPVTQRVLFA